MARLTLVFGSSIGAASLPETICNKKISITILTNNKLVTQESIIYKVRLNKPKIISDLTSSCAVMWLESEELTIFEEIE